LKFFFWHDEYAIKCEEKYFLILYNVNSSKHQVHICSPTKHPVGASLFTLHMKVIQQWDEGCYDYIIDILLQVID
jgi:hypothetical protein